MPGTETFTFVKGNVAGAKRHRQMSMHGGKSGGWLPRFFTHTNQTMFDIFTKESQSSSCWIRAGSNMKRIPVHCSLSTFLNDYEDQLFGFVNTIINGDIMVEGRILLIFGVGGYYPDSVRECIKEVLV